MKLDLGERFVIMQILPKTEDLFVMQGVTKLNKLLFPTEKEQKKWEVKPGDDGLVRWNVKKNTDAEVEISARMHVVIANELKKLHTEKKVEDKHLSLFDKFEWNTEEK
jgi:hypothetical protein